MLLPNKEVEERDMIPELNTVISVSSVLMLALSNNNSKAELRAGKHSQPQSSQGSQRSLGSSEHIKYFNPHPSMVASGLCSYKYITNTVPNRIPGKIKTQIVQIQFPLWIKRRHMQCYECIVLDGIINVRDRMQMGM